MQARMTHPMFLVPAAMQGLPEAVALVLRLSLADAMQAIYAVLPWLSLAVLATTLAIRAIPLRDSFTPDEPAHSTSLSVADPSMLTLSPQQGADGCGPPRPARRPGGPARERDPARRPGRVRWGRPRAGPSVAALDVHDAARGRPGRHRRARVVCCRALQARPAPEDAVRRGDRPPAPRGRAGRPPAPPPPPTVAQADQPASMASRSEA